MAEEEKWFEAMMEKDERVRPFAIEARQGEAWALVGSCSLFDFDDIARNAELGIMIGERSQWGLGLGTDAMRALLDHGFDTLNLRRIYLRVLAFNERAIRLYEKLGFEHEGRLREHVFARGQYSDTLIMGMMRDNWRAGQGSET
jgi:RimJ/RimL family protein N-acetyltransferase